MHRLPCNGRKRASFRTKAEQYVFPALPLTPTVGESPSAARPSTDLSRAMADDSKGHHRLSTGDRCFRSLEPRAPDTRAVPFDFGIGGSHRPNRPRRVPSKHGTSATPTWPVTGGERTLFFRSTRPERSRRTGSKWKTRPSPRLAHNSNTTSRRASSRRGTKRPSQRSTPRLGMAR